MRIGGQGPTIEDGDLGGESNTTQSFLEIFMSPLGERAGRHGSSVVGSPSFLIRGWVFEMWPVPEKLSPELVSELSQTVE